MINSLRLVESFIMVTGNGFSDMRNSCTKNNLENCRHVCLLIEQYTWHILNMEWNPIHGLISFVTASKASKIIFADIYFYCLSPIWPRSPGSSGAQWVKRWPTDLAD